MVYKVYKNVKLSNEGYKVWNYVECTVEITDPIFCTVWCQLYTDIFKGHICFFWSLCFYNFGKIFWYY